MKQVCVIIMRQGRDISRSPTKGLLLEITVCGGRDISRPYHSSVSPPFKGGLGGSLGGLFLLQNHINQGSHIAHVDHAVAVDVAHGVGVDVAAEDFVDQGGNIAHVHFAIAIDVARGL